MCEVQYPGGAIGEDDSEGDCSNDPAITNTTECIAQYIEDGDCENVDSFPNEAYSEGSSTARTSIQSSVTALNVPTDSEIISICWGEHKAGTPGNCLPSQV